ncbi:hypothetical protein KIPB_014901 [Kipferlia bialata]|uniref:Uncharacterized protein n=1 Tax=Kipferlia bialata TaxID=797122 RepID=A0A9K3GQL9_9EUKA|nr:hypothetical protein KIPB_014901 [Kipferlia bialata]|eukprot:g14901.t1
MSHTPPTDDTNPLDGHAPLMQTPLLEGLLTAGKGVCFMRQGLKREGYTPRVPSLALSDMWMGMCQGDNPAVEWPACLGVCIRAASQSVLGDLLSLLPLYYIYLLNT